MPPSTRTVPGRLLVALRHDCGCTDGRTSFVIFSDDHGQTWHVDAGRALVCIYHNTYIYIYIIYISRYILAHPTNALQLKPFLNNIQGDIELPDADKRFDPRNIEQQKWDLVDGLLRPIINDILLNKHKAASLGPMQ